MVQVSITEMYDMATVKDKIGIIGIHTPSMASIARRWHGLMDNHKFIKILGCDVSVACASILPADPLQVGLDADQIAPQDIMNPILYRACTNESWNTVLNRLFAITGMTDVNSVKFSNDAFPNINAAGQERIYYILLSESGWKKAMPQAGLSMRGLRPLVFPILNTYGNTEIVNGQGAATFEYPQDLVSDNGGNPVTPSVAAIKRTTFRGPAQPMPRIPCHRPGSASDSTATIYPWPVFSLSDVPNTYVGCMIMPPNKSGNVMYFRMIITWHVEFSGLVSVFDKESALDVAGVGANFVYNRTYVEPTSKLDGVAGSDDHTADTNSVETMNADINLVLEK